MPELGLSPEVVHVEPGITVMRFIAGRTFGEADMREQLARIVPLLKTCHREVGRRLQGPANMFWVFHVIRDYVRAANADPKYLATFHRTASWFRGENSLRRSLIDARRGACYDGLQPTDVNRNQGAESTLAYIAAELHDLEIRHALAAGGQAAVASA